MVMLIILTQIWDLRTGSIYDAYGYDSPVTSMMFDARRIVTAAGEDVVKVYDKTDGRQWDCGAGAAGDESHDEGGSDSTFGMESVVRGVEALEAAEVVEEYAAAKGKKGARGVVERVRIKDGFMIEGRRDGVVGVWSC